MMGKGQELYTKAKTRIPGGTQLLSKRPEMHLPDQWPSYYSRARGVDVWDLDGNHFVDMSYNGIGSCILGVGDPDVDAAVLAAIASGSMSTLNCPEEVRVAGSRNERLERRSRAPSGPRRHRGAERIGDDRQQVRRHGRGPAGARDVVVDVDGL